MNDKFTNISFKINNLDIFHTRKSIFSALNEALAAFKGNFLDVGCGKMPYRTHILSSNNVISSYIGLDIETARDYGDEIKPDIFWTKDGLIPLANDSIDSSMATEVLEHCPNPQHILNEISRVLRKDGIFFMTVPFIWNLHEVPYDEHRYTPFALKRYLKSAGFQIIEIKGFGGWNSFLGLALSLWVRRKIKNQFAKFIMSCFFFPIIWLLYKFDKPVNEFKEGVMITGIYIIAQKK